MGDGGKRIRRLQMKERRGGMSERRKRLIRTR
jgi:hypothetical protein